MKKGYVLKDIKKTHILLMLKHILIERTTEINERDGICINSETPNYEVVSIKKYTFHKLVELKKL